MSDPPANPESVDDLAQDFIERYRAGQHPSLTEYVEKNPELEQEIRELFPAMVVMERLRPRREELEHADHVATSRIPEQLGEYRVLREVGRGGMGVVYEAEQASLGRHVAIKVLPTHAVLNGNLLKRFQHEARAAARLHHTNIVPVFGVGEHQGIHYYAMQFIQGHALDEVLEELRRLRSRESSDEPQRDGPRTELASQSAGDGMYFRSVARIGVQVAEALAHAHSQGVLHRDIKPSNLLLDASSNVWVTDFGLAKHDGDELTGTGDVVGTLRYMAPERFQGKSDARSDVYSLGATLYELVTLRPAFQASDRAALIREITSTEPALPRKIDPRIPKDLETIVLKAIEKDPRRRYGEAAELADDLRRFLGFLPIQARRNSPLDRLGRWCRRNPAQATLAAALMLALAAGIAGILSQWQRAERHLSEVVLQSGLARTNLAESQRQRTLAEQNLAEAQRQRGIAEENLQEAQRQTLRAEQNYEIARNTIDGLFNMFTGNSSAARSVPLPVRRHLLQLAIEYQQGLAAQGSDHPETLAELALSYLRIARVQISVGATQAALDACQDSVNLLAEATTKHPSNTKLRDLLAMTYSYLGQYQVQVGQLAAAGESLERSIAEWQNLLKSDPDSPNYLNGLAGAYNNQGYLLSQLGDLSQSNTLHQQSIDIREKLVARQPRNKQYKRSLASAIGNLASRRTDAGFFEEGIALRERAIRLSEELAADSPGNEDLQSSLAANYNRLGDHYRHYTQHPASRDRAIHFYEKAREIQTRLVRDNPGIVPFKRQLAGTYANMAQVHEAHNEHADALARADQAIAIFEELERQQPQTFEPGAPAPILALKGRVLDQLGRTNEAIGFLLQSVERYRMAHRQAPEVGAIRDALALRLGESTAMFRKLQNREPLEECLTALDQARRLNRNEASAVELLFRSMCLSQLRRRNEARDALNDATRLIDVSFPPSSTFISELAMIRDEAESLLLTP